jgi:hypothetical protein
VVVPPGGETPTPSGGTGASRRSHPRAGDGDDDAEDDLILETVIIRPGSIHENDEEE